jgi:hypothetical protein
MNCAWPPSRCGGTTQTACDLIGNFGSKVAPNNV